MNPLSALYGAGMALRNALFDRGVLPTLRLEQPVVSVGNISAGGAGKTPFVIALGELLKQRGIIFDVLSRGYGRKSRGVFVVDPQGTASEYGDEPLLIARKLGVPVIVGESRYDAGLAAEQKFSQSRLHLLDDGFQHRGLARNFDIVLMTASDFEDRLLPAGRLRESLSSLRRADAIVLPRELAVEDQGLRGRPMWRMTRETLLSAVPQCPIVFCALARPQQFFTQVRATGIVPVAEVVFRDHHAYHERDIQRLLRMRKELGSRGFVTTEKDMVNLGDLRAGLEAVAVAGLKLTIDRSDELVDTILTRIAERKPGLVRKS